MEKENNVLKKWLDKLQEESWNLELIISGFSIFGLFKAKAFLESQYLFFEANDIVSDTLIAWFHVLYLMVFVSVYISIVFLLVHVFLRGLWIGAIGIRYVSDEIDYDKLNYNTTIAKYLKKKLGSFDDYILKLEKISSLIFGYTFLLILILCSAYLYFLFIWIVVNIFGYFFENTRLWWISTIALIFTMVLALLIVIDLFTGGVFKRIKNKRIVKTYIFIHKVVNWITLSFLWKPLYFNLIDHKKTRWLIYFVVPFFALMFVVNAIDYNAHFIFPSKLDSTEKRKISSVEFKEKARVSFQTRFYDNLRKEDEVVYVMSLPNHKMESKSIELFVKFYNRDEDYILKKDSTIKKLTIRGFSSSMVAESEYKKELFVKGNSELIKQQLYRENLNKILLSAKKLYSIKINGEYIVSDSIDIMFHEHANSAEEGFLLLFSAENIKKGTNLLTLEKQYYHKEENKKFNFDFSIPFMYIGQ